MYCIDNTVLQYRCDIESRFISVSNMKLGLLTKCSIILNTGKEEEEKKLVFSVYIHTYTENTF